MILDALWLFSAAAGDSPTTGSQTSTNVVDLGLTGLPASAGGGGARDIGIGDDPAMKLMVVVLTTFTGGTSLQINVQGAPDNGSGSPGSYTIMAAGPVVAEAQLVAGARLLDIDFPRPAPNQVVPRFIQLGYVSVGTHGAGKLESALVLDRMDQITAAPGVMSAYPPGITIAN
jgi:hypothetical protein